MILSEMTTMRKLMLLHGVVGGKAVEDFASGNPCVFTTDLAKPLRKLALTLLPKQNLNGQDAPWPAGGGVNVLDFAQYFTEGETVTQNGITSTFSNGYLRVTGTNQSSTFNIVYKSCNVTLPAGTYIMPSNLNIRCDIDGQGNSNYASSITAQQSVKMAAFYVFASANATVNYNIPMMLVKGTTRPTSYSPYSNICPIIPWENVGTWTGGRNLFTTEGEAKGRYIDSSDVSKSYVGWNHSDYIPVKPDTEYVFEPHSTSGQVAKTWFYDADKVGISYLSSGTATFTTPSNCHFMRFSYRDTSYDIQLEVGNTATPYVPYSPIVAHPVNVGKNLVKTKDSSRESAGITYTVNDDGSVKAYGTTPENSTSWFRAGTDYETQGTFLKKGTYRLTGGKSNDKLLYIVGKYVDGTTISNQTVTGGVYDKGEGLTFTLTDDAYITYQIQIRKGFSIDDTFYPMIRFANNGDDTFQPYLHPVYGASVDLTTGEVWGTWIAIDLSTMGFSYRSNWNCWVASADSRLEIVQSNSTPTKAVMEQAKAVVATGYTGSHSQFTFSQNTSGVWFYDNGSTENAPSGLLIAPLATPVLLATLTPQQISALVGVNTVWSDADGIELTYLKKG